MEKADNQNFIIPYIDQNLDFWEKIRDNYASRIKAVYIPVLNSDIGSGRPQQADKHLINFLESNILPVSMLINPIILAKPVGEIAGKVVETLKQLCTHYNIVELTLTNHNLARIVKSELPDLKLSASTLMEIYHPQQIIMLEDVYDTLVPSNKAIRDLKTLKTLRDSFSGKIRILVNESCLASCIYRTQHFYEMSRPEIVYPHALCNNLLIKYPWLRLTGGWILPQHLYFIDGLYDEIKLAGRVTLQNPDNYIKVLDSYIHKKPLNPNEIGGGPASIGFPLDIEKNFYEYTLNCDKNCFNCLVCNDYWNKH